jgi:hypothetical protein
MAYADDIVIIAQNTKALNELVSQMQPAAKEAGLTINRTKTKYMESSKNRTNGLSNITLNRQPYEGISGFKYSRTSLHRSRYLRFPAYIVCLIWSRN